MSMKILAGIPAAPGIASGKALLFPDDNPEIPRYAVSVDQTGAELVRFAEAVRAAVYSSGIGPMLR
jgi:phosphoenolpyruvate-protein kinase (PTS system EI component)